jgi:putative transposase
MMRCVGCGSAAVSERPERTLTPALAETLGRRRRGKVGRSWHVDETYLKVQGRWVYLYRPIDRSGALAGC